MRYANNYVEVFNISQLKFKKIVLFPIIFIIYNCFVVIIHNLVTLMRDKVINIMPIMYD
jgi:hypothetical protein